MKRVSKIEMWMGRGGFAGKSIHFAIKQAAYRGNKLLAVS